MININFKQRPKPVLLVVLDGWGIAPFYSGNAISQTKLPNYESLIARYPATILSAAGEAAGVPWGAMGNSEVGHLNLGSGRIVYQDLPRINKAISDNSFFDNSALKGAIENTKINNSKLHYLGLISTGGIHAAIEHLIALLAFASEHKLKQVYLHLFLDGRDMPYNSGRQLVMDVEKKIVEYKIGKIATLSGRFYAMDRNNHWDRVKKTYNAIALGKCDKFFATPGEAIEYYYSKKVYDEEFVPSVITNNNKPIATIDDKDSVVFFNFRSDRARQMSKVFVLPDFDKFERMKKFDSLYFVTMTEYEKNLPVHIAFPPETIKNTLGQVLSDSGLKQLRIAETEKYAHVTYFFNGGAEEAMLGEERVVIPSVNVESYADEPKMSAPEIFLALKKALSNDKYDFILVNFANADMVGHTGDMDATIKGINFLDKILGDLTRIIIAKDGAMLVTADHGNAEEMFNMQTGSITKEHSTNPVPLLIINKSLEGQKLSRADISGADLSILKPQGILADVAPTILKIMNIKKPPEMTGRSLI
ncbi:MAG: 2,3-bisphosphoglycerate-independent phosphoglycerate mutase [bacterium]|nr:2,3-bisphosphoglycerate-independent phosphoglycerate mutase [bacterium]